MTTTTEKRLTTLTVNGNKYELEVDPNKTLLQVLRDDLNLTGAKKACDYGECGSCIVLLGNKGVMSCLLAVSRADGKAITTVEGLAKTNGAIQLDPLQQAFIESGASQCGFCIPGMIMQARALLLAKPSPTREDVVKYLARNVCRCTGYVKIVDAVMKAAAVLRGEQTFVKSHQNGNGHLVGQSIDRLDTLNEVIGEAKYAGDLSKPGMLHVKVLRSTHHHANILSIDSSEAEKMPDVEVVVTAKDIPGKRYMLNGRPQMLVFPEDKVRYYGEGLAAVAAVSEEAAEEAVKRIKVEYEPLAPILHPRDALRDDLPQIIEGVPNVDPEVARASIGDVEEGFAKADVIVEREYTTPYWEHMAMEPEAAFAYWDEEGRMTVHVPLHHSFKGQEFIAEMLALPKDRVRIICPAMGGSFGARGDFYAASMAALVAYKTNRPARIVYTREESLLGSCKHPEYHFKYKTGATKDGKLVAMYAEMLVSGGSWAPYMAEETGGQEMIMYGRLPLSQVFHATGPYYIPNVEAVAREACTNTARATPLRGTVGPPLAFVYESQMDELADKLGMDPLEFRIKNVLAEGSETHYGQIMDESADVKDCLESLKPYYEEAKAWAAQAPDDSIWKRGVGVAAGWRSIIKSGVNQVLAAAELLDDGKVRIVCGVVEKGQGPMTTMAQIASQEIGLPWGRVEMLMGDTYLAPYAVETNSSKITIMVGTAVQDASRKLKQAIKEAAASALEENPDSVSVEGGYAFPSRFPGEKLSFQYIASFMKQNDMPIMYEGRFAWPPGEEVDPNKNIYEVSGRPNILYAFTAQVSQVEVNVETGAVRVPRAVHSSDPGTVINPKTLEGQIEGGMTFGMGFALSEEYVPGETRSYKDYKVTTIRNVYEDIKVLFVGKPLAIGPFGARGAGEMANVAPVPSITNGISRATGVRVFDLPATPEKIRNAMGKQES